MKLLSIQPTSIGDKAKFEAKFLDNGKIKTVKFGVKGSYSYVDGAPIQVRDAYRARHYKERTGPVDSKGMLSYWVTWGDSQDVNKNIADYKKKNRL